jgi:hypothetical protein
LNAKKAKALRRIARALKLPESKEYAPVGPIRERPAIKDHGRSYSAGIVRRPFALKACERRAYLEAKLLYKTHGLEFLEGAASAPDLREPAPAFKDRVYQSIEKQPEAPVYGGTEQK